MKINEARDFSKFLRLNLRAYEHFIMKKAHAWVFLRQIKRIAHGDFSVCLGKPLLQDTSRRLPLNISCISNVFIWSLPARYVSVFEINTACYKQLQVQKSTEQTTFKFKLIAVLYEVVLKCCDSLTDRFPVTQQWARNKRSHVTLELWNKRSLTEILGK